MSPNGVGFLNAYVSFLLSFGNEFLAMLLNDMIHGLSLGFLVICVADIYEGWEPAYIVAIRAYLEQSSVLRAIPFAIFQQE